jgi:hypothetical protein
MEKLRKTIKNIVNIADLRTEIWTQDFLNTKQEYYPPNFNIP